MSSLHSDSLDRAADPLDLVEQIVAANEWPYDRQNDQELTVFVAGNWSEYHLHFSQSGDRQGLQVVCAFDSKVPVGAKSQLMELMTLINAQMWIGHFDLVPEEGLLMFRHGVLMGSFGATPEQLEELIEIAITECEKFFPAFQFVLWGGKTATEAIEAAMFETVGEA